MIKKLIMTATLISALLNLVIFVGTVVELLYNWVGSFGYILWIVAAPIMSPAMAVLPWFVAGVDGDPVSNGVLTIWLSFYVCLLLNFIFNKQVLDS
jgi:hypothetical protein